MEKPYPNWNSLPFEILQSILQQAATREMKEELCIHTLSNDRFLVPEEYDPTLNLCKYALVCKTWVHPVQYVMYSYVCIYSLSQLRKFFSTVENNASLGTMVKVFCVHKLASNVNIRDETTIKAEIYGIITTLLSTYLFKLEEIRGYGGNSYLPVLYALRNFGLKRLKKITTPDERAEKSEIDNYVKCVLLMKDRIEVVTILDDNRYVHGAGRIRLPFHRLFPTEPIQQTYSNKS